MIEGAAVNIGIAGIVVFVVLLISGSMGYIVITESLTPGYERIIMFMGRKGEVFLNVLIIITLPLFVGSAIYLGFKAWILCAIGVPLNFIINRYISPLVLKLVILPVYAIFSLLYRGEE